jgi:predicted ATPase
VNGVVVGEKTYLATRDAIAYEETEPVVAKGKTEPVRAWVALKAVTEAGRRPPGERAIVGRHPELQLFGSIWARVISEQHPHLVSVFGPAGVGKSTVVWSFAREARSDGAQVVRGRALPYRESGAYGALATQVLRLCGAYESDAPGVIAEKLHERTRYLLADSPVEPRIVAGHLGALVGIDAGGSAAGRDELFSSARWFIEATAREQPTILVFEDMHWADASLLDLIETLAAQSHALPLLLVTLARPELLDNRQGWGGRLASYTSVTLGPLGTAQARELALRRLGDATRLDEVVDVAEGNPLFIEQLAATMEETAPGVLPTSIRGLVAARLDALPQQDRALLLDAAVVGRVFWSDVLTALNPDPDVERTLDELERRDLIRRDPSSILENQQQFAFTHSLIRDVAYELLPRADRARLHRTVAEFFEQATGASGEAIGALARHWRDAGDHDRAIAQLTRAAEVAERGWAKGHATMLYREALELVPPDDTGRRTQLTRRLALASAASFHLEDVRRPESPPA